VSKNYNVLVTQVWVLAPGLCFGVVVYHLHGAIDN